jgi:hypothetical protein
VTTRRALLPCWLAVALVFATLVATPMQAQAFTTRADVTTAAAHYGTVRGFHLGVAVLDLRTGWFYGGGDYAGTFASESVVKAFIATRLLATGQMHGTTETRAWKMITQSDDAIASSLYGRVGGDGLINWVKHRYHLWGLGTRPSLPGWWGNTHITPVGLVHFYAHVRSDPKVGPWLIDAMHHAHTYGSDGVYQFFGLPSATTGAAVKQGWGCDYDDFCTRYADFNSTGYVNGDRFAVALLARGPLSSYGSEIAAILTGAARRLLPGGVFPARRPVISSMTTHWGAAAGGAHIIVHGQGFEKVASVDFGWTRAPSFAVLSPWRIRVRVPAHIHGTVHVRVVTAAGQSPPSRVTPFTFVSPPWVSSLSAHSGRSAGGNTLTITGYNFRRVAGVAFGAVPSSKVSIVSSHELRVLVPAHDPGLIHVNIVTAFGTALKRPIDEYRFVAVPEVRQVDPASVSPAGTRVTVRGVGYRDVQSVQVDGVAGSGVTVDSWGRLSFLAPPHAPGVTHVQVTTPYGRSALSSADQLSYT